MVRLRSVVKAGRALPVAGRTLDAERKSLYGHRWRVERIEFLKANPFCVHCLKKKLYVAATVVDHIVPHAGNAYLFWDRKNNWQSLCLTCHNSWKQSQEKTDGHGTTGYL